MKTPNPEKREIKVIIGVPCADSASMKAHTAHSIGCNIIGSEGLVIDFLLRISCDIVSNRTWLVNEAIKRGATHLLFVDCDMLFPENALRQLLSHRKEIVGVEYNKREFPLKGVYEPLTDISKSATELYKAKHVGLGLTLIDLSVFDNMKAGWFNFGRDSQGALAIGEDVWFCNSARDAGHDVWIDPTIKMAHIGEYWY